MNEVIYTDVNNGVYKAGFATSQQAYEDAVDALFKRLDWVEARLETQRYLVGTQLTEADIRLFTTLVRFDSVYFGHFKCNLRRLVDYPNLWGYARDLFQRPRLRRDRELRSHQAPLLHDARPHQPDAHRAERADHRLDGAARPRAAGPSSGP